MKKFPLKVQTYFSSVILGLDPRIHSEMPTTNPNLTNPQDCGMDPRVKPEDDIENVYI